MDLDERKRMATTKSSYTRRLSTVTPDDVIKVARSQVGYTESPPGSNDTKYGRWYGLNGEPWCAMFQSWCFHRAGFNLQIETPKGFSWTVAGLEWFQKNGHFYADRIQRGDLVFFSFDSDPGPEHVGLCIEDWDRFSGKPIKTIDGNTGIGNDANGGEVMERERPGTYVIGGGRLPLRRSGERAKKGTKVLVPRDGFPHPLLKKGSAYPRAVRHLQKLLLAHGFNIVVDGVFGQDTLTKLKKFQELNRLRPDGQVGPYTWAALHRGLKK